MHRSIFFISFSQFTPHASCRNGALRAHSVQAHSIQFQNTPIRLNSVVDGIIALLVTRWEKIRMRINCFKNRNCMQREVTTLLLLFKFFYHLPKLQKGIREKHFSRMPDYFLWLFATATLQHVNTYLISSIRRIRRERISTFFATSETLWIAKFSVGTCETLNNIIQAVWLRRIRAILPIFRFTDDYNIKFTPKTPVTDFVFIVFFPRILSPRHSRIQSAPLKWPRFRKRKFWEIQET